MRCYGADKNVALQIKFWVELLVVIAIIAVLLSILMPSLRKAREQARLVICKARQSQLGLANIMYADEVNDGVTLNGVTINTSVPPGNSDRVRTGVAWDICSLTCNGGSYGGLALLFSTGILDQSRKSATIFFCPSIPKNNLCSADFIELGLAPANAGYGKTNLDRIMLGDFITGGAPLQIMVGSQVRNRWSSGVFPNGAGTHWNLESTPGKWGYNLASETKYSFISDPWPGYHNGKGSAWYLDGHVKSWDGRNMKTRDWYRKFYLLAYWVANAVDPPRCTQDQILMNYGSCFRWIDGNKSMQEKDPDPLF